MTDLTNEITYVVAEPETYDTPTHRATIAQLSIDELDAWLDRIRARRLVAVKKLEAAAKVRADSVRLTTFLKLETSVKVAKRALVRLDEQITKTEKLVHKSRLLAMAAQLEVGMEEEADAA
jgi:hypothetical protein